MTRQQLKSIVKECLLEILQEGLGRGSVGFDMPIKQKVEQQHPSIRNTMNQPVMSPQKKKISPLDMPAASYGQKRPSQAMSQIIKTEARGNPIMADILADTAMTTLPNMLSGGDSSSLTEGSVKHSISQQEQFTGTPEQVFGVDTASRWANLAFMDAPNKKLT